MPPKKSFRYSSNLSSMNGSMMLPTIHLRKSREGWNEVTRNILTNDKEISLKNKNATIRWKQAYDIKPWKGTRIEVDNNGN